MEECRVYIQIYMWYDERWKIRPLPASVDHEYVSLVPRLIEHWQCRLIHRTPCIQEMAPID